jgi:hypothetical protein
MFAKTLTLAAAAFGALTMAPAAAEARNYDRGYSGRYYDGGYYQPVRQYRGDRYYGGDRRYYRGDRYRGDRYYGGRRYYRGGCRDKGTGGTIIGAIAGGLLGNEVAGRRGDGTTGAIIGAGVGALAGRAIDRNC